MYFVSFSFFRDKDRPRDNRYLQETNTCGIINCFSLINPCMISQFEKWDLITQLTGLKRLFLMAGPVFFHSIRGYSQLDLLRIVVEPLQRSDLLLVLCNFIQRSYSFSFQYILFCFLQKSDLPLPFLIYRTAVQDQCTFCGDSLHADAKLS